MESFFIMLGYGFLSLVGVSVLVALWEYSRGSDGRKAVTPAPAQPRRVDVDLVHLENSPELDEQTRREQALSAAMANLATPPDLVWTDTRPTVLQGTEAKAEAQPQAH